MLTGNKLDAKLELRQSLGSGHYATVYKALLEGNTIAVKRFKSPKERNSELQLLKTFNSPYIIKPLKAPQNDKKDDTDIMLPFMSLGDLFEYLLTNNENIYVRLRIIFEVASGILHLHNMDYLYVDPKPENTLLTEDAYTGVLKAICADLNLSCSETVEQYEGDQALCAPEVILHVTPCTKKSDIYSFGVFMFDLLTRDRADLIPSYWGENPSVICQHSISGCLSADIKTLLRAAKEKTKTLPLDKQKSEGFSPRLADLIIRCTSTHPPERPTIQYVLHELVNLLAMNEKDFFAEADNAADAKNMTVNFKPLSNWRFFRKRISAVTDLIPNPLQNGTVKSAYGKVRSTAP